MPGRSFLDIIFRSIDQTKAGTDSAAKNLSSIKSGIKGVLGGAAALTGAMVVVGATMKKALDMGEEGAQVVQTTESFDLLLKKVGAAPDLLDQLRTASRGTIDDMSLMSSTATLLAGASGELVTELADATPQLMSIAKAANKLNPALGDTSFMYKSIATGIKRASPLILDNLGLTIKIGEANEKYAKTLGKAVEELTAEEAKVALLNATLEAGNVLIEQVGGNTDALSDPFQRLGAATKNIADKFKADLAPTMADVAEKLADLITAGDRLTNEFEEHSGAVRQAGKTYKEYIHDMLRFRVAQGQLAKDVAETIDILYDSGGAVGNLVKAYGILDEAEFNRLNLIDEMIEKDQEQIEHLQRLGYVNIDVKEEVENLIDAEERLKQEQDRLNDKLKELDFLIEGRLGKQFDEFTDKNEELAEKAAKIKDEISKLEGKKYLTTKQKEQLEDLRADLGEVDAALAENAKAHEEATKRILFSMLEQRAAVDGLTELEVANLTTIAEAWGLVDEETATAMRAINANIGSLDTTTPDQLLRILEKLFNLPSSKTITVTTLHKEVHGATEHGKASGGSVVKGKVYPVGERGIELFAPWTDGYIIPNDQISTLGDRIIVTPPGQKTGIGGAAETVAPMHVTLNIYDSGAAALAMAEIKRMREERIARVT